MLRSSFTRGFPEGTPSFLLAHGLSFRLFTLFLCFRPASLDRKKGNIIPLAGVTARRKPRILRVRAVHVRDFLKRYRELIVIGSLLAATIVVWLAYRKDGRDLNALDRAVLTVTAPISRAVNAAAFYGIDAFTASPIFGKSESGTKSSFERSLFWKASWPNSANFARKTSASGRW